MLQNESTPSDKKEKFWDYFNMEMSDLNMTDRDVTMPAPEQGLVIGVYSALLVIGAVGNVGVFASLLRSRRRKSRVNLLMTHLVVADLMVTFIVIPLEVSLEIFCVGYFAPIGAVGNVGVFASLLRSRRRNLELIC